MSDIIVAAFLLSASLFLMGTFLLPGNATLVRSLWSATRLGQPSLGQAVLAAKLLGSQSGKADTTVPPAVKPLQVGMGALGLLGGLFLSVVLPFAPGRWLFPLISGILCYEAPALLLRQSLATRRRAVLRELPQVVSILRVVPHRDVATALAAVVRRRHGPLAVAIREALERNATGVPLLDAMGEATGKLQVEELGRFPSVLSQALASSSRTAELLRTYEQELLSRRRERALRAVETSEGKISAVLTVATAMQLVLLLVVPSMLRFLSPGSF